ncbi:unnamed protein product [Schistosoma turkestanicum]|nr:unnamed protein product [Schistosoma turkestanicum]
MVSALKNPIRHLVIGEVCYLVPTNPSSQESLVKLVNYLENETVGDVVKKTNKFDTSEFKSFLQALETLAKKNTKYNETQIHYNAVKRKSEEIRMNLANNVSIAEQNLIDAHVIIDNNNNNNNKINWSYDSHKFCSRKELETEIRNKLKEAIEVEPILIQETINMKNKIETIKVQLQTLTQTFKEYQKTFNELKQQLIELDKQFVNKQNMAENLFIWIRKNEDNLTSHFNGKLNQELNELNQLSQEKSEAFYKIKMNEIELETENDRCKKLILNYQNEIAKCRRSIELLESRLVTAQDLLQVSNVDYNRTQMKHISVKDELELTKSRTRMEQDEKQNMLKHLRHKIEEECAIKSKLMIDFENSLLEFEKIKQDGYQKRLELEATAKQLESNIENVKLELEAVRLNHNHSLDQLNIIQNEYKQFENEWNQEYSTMSSKVQTLNDSLLKSKAQFNELKTKFEEMISEKNFLEEKQDKLKLSLLALMKVKLRGTTKLSQLRNMMADLTKTNKTIISELSILKGQTEQMSQLQTKRELQQSNLMKTRDLVLKKLKEELREKLNLNLTLSDQYIKMQEEQSKLLSIFNLAVTNADLDQNQLFNAEQTLALWARILRQRNYWELILQAKHEALVDDLSNQNHQINQQISEIKEMNMNIKPKLSIECKI